MWIVSFFSRLSDRCCAPAAVCACIKFILSPRLCPVRAALSLAFGRPASKTRNPRAIHIRSFFIGPTLVHALALARSDSPRSAHISCARICVLVSGLLWLDDFICWPRASTHHCTWRVQISAVCPPADLESTPHSHRRRSRPTSPPCRLSPNFSDALRTHFEAIDGTTIGRILFVSSWDQGFPLKPIASCKSVYSVRSGSWMKEKNEHKLSALVRAMWN